MVTIYDPWGSPIGTLPEEEPVELEPALPEGDILFQLRPLLRAVFNEADPDLVLEWAERNSDKFFNIIERSKLPEARTLEGLFYQPPRPEPAPAIDFAEEFEPARDYIGESLPKLYPEMKREDFVKWVNEKPDEFLDELQILGRTPDTENLLRGLGVSPDEVFVPPVSKQWWTLDFWLENLFKPYGGKDLKGKVAASFMAGIGDVISTTGGAARWLGYENAGRVLSTIGSTLQRVAPPTTTGEFDLGDLMNPDWYAEKVVRTIPFSLSLLPLAIGGFTGGAAIATAVGLGRIGSLIVGGLAGAALSRPLESAMEAGNTYDDAIARGKTEKEAKDEADEVFKKNMTLAGMDAFQIAIALAPTPKWVPSSLVKAGLVRTARIGGKMVIVGLSEGGEEVYQDMVQRHARGEEWQLDPISKEVFAIGAVMGLGMGLGGDLITGIVDRAKTKMSGSLKGKFDEAVDGFIKEGFRPDQAELKALDTIAQTPEGEKIVGEVIKEVAPEARVIAPEVIPTEPVKPTPMPTKEAVVKPAVPVTQQRGLAKELKRIAPLYEKPTPVTPEVRVAQPKEGEFFTDDFGNKWLVAKTEEHGAVKFQLWTKVKGQDVSVWARKLVGWQEQRAKLQTQLEQVAIPRAEVGMPEAGYQPAMFEEVVDREVRPLGKAELRQISMDDQLKLKQAFEAAEEAAPEVREAYEAQAEIEGLEITHELDPVAQWRTEITVARKVKQKDGTFKLTQFKRSVGLDFFIDIKEQSFPSYFTVKQAQMIAPYQDWSHYTQKGTKDYNRVPRDAVLDELGDKWNMTDSEIADRVMAIRREKARIKELQRVEAIEPVEEKVARLSEQMKAKLKAEEAYKQKMASPEAEMEANRENNLKMVSEPRQEGEIPRQTVRHPSHYRGMEDFNVEVKKELLTGIPESPLDMAAAEYLKTGDFSKYIEAMPDVSELKLAALTAEVHTAVEELTTARQLAVEEVTDLRAKKAEALKIEYAEETVKMWDALIAEAEAKQDLFGGFIEKANKKTPLTVDDAVALGIALRRTKGGKLVVAIRRSGFYVTQEFVDSPHLQNVPYVSGFWQDVDSLFEHIDGGRAAGTPDAPAVAQKYIQRPSNRNFLAYKRFLDTNFKQAQDMFERFGLVGRISKQKWADVFNTIEQITAAEADFKTDQLLRKTEIKALLAKYDIETRTNIVEFAQWSRTFLDQMRGFQNEARAKRGQKEIGYIDKYMAWVAERNIWSSLGFQKRTPADMHIKAPAPDFIFPDAPFNPRAMAREGGMKNYPMERNVHKLMFDYIRTAGKDIFFTNTVQNNKIHIAALKAKGLDSTATLLQEYNAEVWAGAKPRITKAYEAFLPKPIPKATYMLRRQLTRNVFPLNWAWNLTIQPSSIAFTAGRTGFINLAKGLDFVFSSDARAFAQDTYSYIIKSKRAGRMAFQDIGTQVEQSLQFEGTLIDKAEYYASLITNTMESFLTGVSIRAGYYKGRQLGFTGQELVEYASKMGAKTQSMYNFENVPAVLRAKPVGALFPFQTFCIQAMNTIREMNYIRVGKAGAYNTISATSAQGKATISQRLMLTTAFLITILVINAVIDRWTNRKPWILSSFIPMFAILQAGFEPGMAWYLPLPQKYINDFWRGFNDAVKFEDFTRLKQWVLIYHFPFGGTQINRMLDGVEAVLKGEVTDVKGKPKFEVKPGEWLKAIFMGPYQTEGGREYIDRLEEKKEKKAKWYEYLKLPILISRVDINKEIEDSLAKLGEIDEDGMRYDFGDLASDIREIRRAVGLKRFDKSVSPLLDGFKKAEVSREHYESLPPKKLINMDEYDISDFLFPEPDEKDAETVALWAKFNKAKTRDERLEVITSYIEANKDALKDNKLVENYGLLQDYWSLIGKDKVAFAKKYDVLTKDWRSEWRRDNPEDDALLAMWDYGGKIQTQKAYDYIIKWCKEYGVDTAHLSTWLPPEGSEENYFKYQAEVLKRSWNSWEAQLILAKDDNLREALGFDSIKTPIASLELKVKHRDKFDLLKNYGVEDSSDYIKDEKARAVAVDKLRRTKVDGVEFRDIERRVDAIEKGTDEAPTPEPIIINHIDYMRIIDEPERGSSSAEAMLLRVDNPDYDKFRTDKNIWGDKALKPIDRSKIPAWRITAKYRKEDAAYDALPEKGDARSNYLATHEEYRKDRRRREAYQATSPEGVKFLPDQIENYVAYWELEMKGFRRERFLIENPHFASAMLTMEKIKELPDPATIPSVQYDDIYDQYRADFNKLDNYGDPEHPSYIDNEKERKLACDAMRFDTDGKYTEFGLAEMRRNGYGKFVPDEHIESYVGYYTIIGEGKPKGYPKNIPYWEDDWFLIEHPDFYKEVYLGILKNDRKDYREVPTREVGAKYLRYQQLSSRMRENYRFDNPDLEDWLILTGKVTKRVSEERRKAELTPAERLAEEVAERLRRIRELTPIK